MDATIHTVPIALVVIHIYYHVHSSSIIIKMIRNQWTATAVSETDVIRSDENSLLTLYTGPSYGGYISIEFARDVELQTSEYITTQENVLSNFIANK